MRNSRTVSADYGRVSTVSMRNNVAHAQFCRGDRCVIVSMAEYATGEMVANSRYSAYRQSIPGTVGAVCSSLTITNHKGQGDAL